MLTQLFQESDHILFMDSGPDKRPLGYQICKASVAPPSVCYYAINPIDPLTNRNTNGAGTPRASINVSAFRNFLFEIDSLPLPTQETLLRKIHPQVPLAQVVYSGGSSLHAIVSVADTLPFKPHTEEGIRSYSQAWRALSTELTAIASDVLGTDCPARLFDPSCKDPARLSRTPNVNRPENKKMQSELDGFGGLVSSDFVLGTMFKHGYSESSVAPPPVEQVSEMDLHLFRLRLLYPENNGLRSKISKVTEWASTENMYPAIFQLTLWVIDSVGAPLNITLAFMQSEIFPALKAAGYPRNPEIAVHNAYIWKGLA